MRVYVHACVYVFMHACVHAHDVYVACMSVTGECTDGWMLIYEHCRYTYMAECLHAHAAVSLNRPSFPFLPRLPNPNPKQGQNEASTERVHADIARAQYGARSRFAGLRIHVPSPAAAPRGQG